MRRLKREGYVLNITFHSRGRDICIHLADSLYCMAETNTTLESRDTLNKSDNKCCSVAKSCPTLRDPMDCSTPGFINKYIICYLK